MEEDGLLCAHNQYRANDAAQIGSLCDDQASEK